MVNVAIQDYYTDLVVQSATRTANGMGGFTETWSDVLQIQGAINQNSGSELLLAAQLNVKSSHKLYTNVGLDITAKDRIKDDDGNLYRIVAPPKNTLQRNHHYKFLLEFLGVDQNG